MSDPRHPAVPPLDAADPRISEWLDGRLPPAEAAAVEQAVGESPELAALAADLKRIRAGLRSLPASAVPAGFSDRVMAGVRAADRPARASGPAAGSTARSPSRQRFPWAVLATALAAGLLVAVVLNLTEPADRQVAMAPTGEPAAAGDDDVWLPPEREADRAGPPPPAAAPVAVAGARDGSARVDLEANAAAAIRPEANEFAVEFATADAAEPATKPAAEVSAEAVAKAASPPLVRGSGKLQLPPLPAGLVVIGIHGPDERLAIERLVAASGLDVASVDGRIEMTGRSAAIDAFLARLERDGWVAGPVATRRKAAREPARDAARADERHQLILRLVERRPPPAEAKAAPETEQP
jgi:hypothetical protein